jgi:hypothetical protein
MYDESSADVPASGIPLAPPPREHQLPNSGFLATPVTP